MSEHLHDAPPPPPSNVVQGIAPPHSIESEQGVLGAVLLSDRAMYSYVVESQLRPEDFYRERHRVVFGAMVELYGESEPIDVLTVTEHLRARAQLDAAGGQAGIDELTAAVPAVGNLKRYGEIVKEMSLLRRLLQATYEIQASVHGRESLPKEIVEQAERAMLEVAHDDSAKAFAAAGTIIEHEIEIWHKLSTEGIALTGTPSGFTDLDTITGGFQPGNLIVVAARPSMGKCLVGGTLVHDPATGAHRRLDAVVEALEAGDAVWVTSVGPEGSLSASRPVAGVRNGVRPVFRLTTTLGRCVVATANHPLLTLGGWKQLDDLRPGDRVAVPAPRALARLTASCVAARGAATAAAAAAARGAGVPFAPGGTTTPGTLDLWWDAVAAIEPAGAQETFDIDVPGDRSFVADDMVVHNSALVTNIAENVALHAERPMPVALFSLEMSEGELAQRFVSSQASIEGDDLRKGRLKDERKWKKVLEAASRYDAAPLFVDDSSDVGVLEIRAKSRRLHQQMQTDYGGLGLIIVDYLQLMRPDGRTDNRVEQVSQMSRGLKILARELGVPVIALSQLSRAVENRPQDQRRPQLSDLRESGAIEQDADLCIFIYRDEYYFPETTEAPGEGELIIAKHRNGSLGTVNLVFQGKYTRFRSMSREYG